MLSDKLYAKFFGNNLIEEIFHLDMELAQAVANRTDPFIEEELERSMELALQEQDAIALVIAPERKKKQPAVVEAFERDMDALINEL